METNTGQNVENTSKSTQVETEPQTNFDAKQIRVATEEKILRKLGVESLEDATNRLKELNEFKETQKTQEEKLAEEKAKLEKEIADQKSYAEKIKRENELRSFGVQEEKLEDAMKLTSGLNGEELQNKVNSYFKREEQAVSSAPKKVATEQKEVKDLSYYRKRHVQRF